MSVIVDTALLPELQRYGAFDISACYNCGNCTAVCPLSTENESFPRKMIRCGQVGWRDKLLATKELWLCYYCGECSDTCPRQAEPGEYMASVRRFAISRYDLTGLARVFYTSTALSLLVTAAFFVILLLFLMTGDFGTVHTEKTMLWEYMDEDVAHYLGLTVIGIAVLGALLGVVNMVIQVSRGNGLNDRADAGNNAGRTGASWAWLPAALKTVFLQVLGHSRYLECDEEKDQPWYLKRWFVHGSTMWGFLGLMLATLTHWILEMAGLKATAEWVPVYSIPIRVWGIVAGVFFVYGTTVLMIERFTKAPDKQATHSVPSDWIFLSMLWISGVSGFVVLIGHYMPPPQTWVYPTLLVHATISMEIVLLAPFTKFAHVFYRTVAVFIHELGAQRSKAPAAGVPG
jgi:nitrate reductase gamma subunit